jgi:hypothetical protein
MDDGFAGCAVVAISEEEASIHTKSALHAAAAAAPIVVYLNRSGGTFYPGANDSASNRSSIVSRPAALPAYGRGDARWTALVDCVREQFARFNVLVTDVEPSAGNYVEAVVAGHPSQLGLSSGIGGIAPIDTYGCRPIERAIAYVFEQNLGTDRNVCEVTAHEVGHTLSLEHEYACEDPMTYLYGCGDKSFQDVSAWCGTYSAVRCSCRGGSQNTVQALLELVGPVNGSPIDPTNDRDPPVVELVSPADRASFVARQPLSVVARASDDLLLARVELIWDFNGQTYGCPLASEHVDCAITGDLYRWKVRAGEGSRTFSVRARDIAAREASTEKRTIYLTEDGSPPPELSDVTPPSIALIGPEDGAIFPPRSRVVVAADVTDDVSVDRVQLAWAFNGQTYGCPSSERYVSCAITGSRYAFTIEVGVEAPRPFTLRAFDTAGHETTAARSIRVATITDTSPPRVAILEPADGAVLPAASEILVVASVADDAGVATATLEWDFNGERYPCPHASTYVDCAIDSDRQTWRVRVSRGSRTFRVTASDAAGNSTISVDRSFLLE